MAKALLGKDVLPDDLPFVTGAIGLLGTRPSYELMRDCDTLLIVGSNFPYSQFLPEYGAARAVQIDIDGSAIGMRYPTEVNIVADAGPPGRADPAADGPSPTAHGVTTWRRTSTAGGNVERAEHAVGQAGQPHAGRLGAVRNGCRTTPS